MNVTLVHANKQLGLFGSDQMGPAYFAAEESGPHRAFTGARLFFANPDTCRSIVALNTEDLCAMQIGKILRVILMVLAVRDRKPASIDALAQVAAGAKTIEAAGLGDAGVGEQNEGQKKTFSIGLGEGKEKQRAEVLPALAAAGTHRKVPKWSRRRSWRCRRWRTRWAR